jgi:predicted nucleic acid-binding protein
MRGIISNTTPINYLVLIDQIDVLHHLYGRVLLQAVCAELQAEGTPSKVKEWVASRPDWLEVRSVSVSLPNILDDLDVGEREAIGLAKELDADALIIDEPEGREAARAPGLGGIGTLRVLYEAAESGLCDLEQVYDRLQQTTFRAHPNLEYSLMRTTSGEIHLVRKTDSVVLALETLYAGLPRSY